MTPRTAIPDDRARSATRPASAGSQPQRGRPTFTSTSTSGTPAAAAAATVSGDSTATVTRAAPLRAKSPSRPSRTGSRTSLASSRSWPRPAAAMPSTSRVVAQQNVRCPAPASARARAVDLNAFPWGRSRSPGCTAAIAATLWSNAGRSTTRAGVGRSPSFTAGPYAVRLCSARPRTPRTGGGIRTHTDDDLNVVPLPLGYAGSGFTIGGRGRGRRRHPRARRPSRRSSSQHSAVPSAAVTFIPPMAQGGSLVSPTHEIFNRLLRERIVFLGSEVDDDIANVICAQLLHLAGEDEKQDVWLYINSPGGSVTAGMAIYDTMQFIEPDVATVCMGLGASMGQFLLCAGAKDKRYALPHARIMMHQPSGGFRGQAADIAIQAEQLLYVKQLMAERIAFHTGQTVDQVLADSERDRWFTAEQAKDYGIIDNVIVKRGEML